MLTIIIPVHNEERALERCVRCVEKELGKLRIQHEIIIAEDGSTDKSYEVALGIAKRDGKVIRVLHSKRRIGRGASLSNAIGKAKGGLVAYVDADLAPGVKSLGAMVEECRHVADVVVGSRFAGGADVKRSFLREFLSRGYNFLVRLLFFSKIMDHQCGLKMMRRARVLPLLAKIKARHWSWDTEFLLRAQRQGLKISEMPVKWREGEGTKVKAGDAVKMGIELLRMKCDGL